MRAYKGLVDRGVIILPEGVTLPEGAEVTVTVGEVEYLRAKMRAALRRNTRRSSKGRTASPEAVGV